jgi:hypothetical protein
MSQILFSKIGVITVFDHIDASKSLPLANSSKGIYNTEN